MSVQVAQKDYFTFIAGLNTEAGYFTFPPNTWKEGDNVIPGISGLISKRPRIDLETNYTTHPADQFTSAIALRAYSVHEWDGSAQYGSEDLLVVQQGLKLSFYKNTGVATSSTRKPTAELDIYSYRTSGLVSIILAGLYPIKCTYAQGKLIVTTPYVKPLLLTYNTSTQTVSATVIDLKIRDFEGVDDGYRGANIATKVPIGSYTSLHQYNLYNQGWNKAQIDRYYTDSGLLYVPSNAQSWIYGKDSSDVFSGTLLDKQEFGNSPAPRGRFIIDVLEMDKSGASGILGIAKELNESSASTCAFFAGRAWYAGFKEIRFVSTVFFSQVVVDTLSGYGQCYQVNDPTAEVLSDLVDSDGGTVVIQDSGEILDLYPFNNGIIVFAEKGIWTISGTSQSGFTATGYEVKRISALGCVSKQSIVVVEDTFLYWSANSICVVDTDNTGGVTVKPLTDNNIRTLYANIPPIAKQYSSGAYNRGNKIVQWVYNKTMTTTDTVHRYQKTHILVLDVRTTAFYTYSITTDLSYPYIADIIVSKEVSSSSVNYDVYVENDNVLSSADDVICAIDASFAVEKQFKYLTLVPTNDPIYPSWKASFADSTATVDAPAKFYDWYSFDSVGVTYSSYVVTGYFVEPTGPSKKHQSTYITTYMQKTETGFTAEYDPKNESSCIMQARWDYTGTSTAGKWDAGQQIYRHTRNFIPSSTSDYDDGYDVVVTKNKVRGRGRALQLKFSGADGYDFKLYGWSVPSYGGTNV